MTHDPFPTPDTWYAHRVSYGETDRMGYAYYGEYLQFFERARSQLIRERGMSYAEVEDRGIMMPVRNASCRYRKPAHYDDLIYVRAAVSNWGRASLTFAYQVWDETKTALMAEGSTEHPCIAPSGKPTRVPDWLKDLFQQD